MTKTDFEWLNVAYDDLQRELARQFAPLSAEPSVAVPMSGLLNKQLGTINAEPKQLSFAVMTEARWPILAFVTLIYLPSEERVMYQTHAILGFDEHKQATFFWSPTE